MLFTALHIFAELSEVQCSDFTAKEQPGPNQPSHWHMVNMVFPAQQRRKGFYPVTEIRKFLKLLCTPVSLLFGTPFCVCRYCLPAGTFEGFGMAFVSMRTLFTLAAMKRYCALTCLGVITAALGFEAPGTLFHFRAFLIEFKISNDIFCLTAGQVRCHQLYVLFRCLFFIVSLRCFITSLSSIVWHNKLLCKYSKKSWRNQIKV